MDLMVYKSRTTLTKFIENIGTLQFFYNQTPHFRSKEVNTEKTEFYCNGIPAAVLGRILRSTGFKLGELPFKYLGVPISSKRLSSKDCFVLCERICSRIRSWGARKLSYAGILVLIRAVLNTLHTYWSSIFLLPSGIMNRIISLCRNYLWDGHEEYHRVLLVSWEKVCQDRKEGGLGLLHCKHWNRAALGKYVWWIEAKKDHLWVKWVNHIYLKGQSWLDYEPPVYTSWAWRKICQVKNLLLAEIQRRWATDNKEYTVKDGYGALNGVGISVNWAHWTWNRFNVPKYSFIVWLVQLERVLTLVRLQRYVHCDSVKCFFCLLEDEDCFHLFFQCNYSKKCLDGISKWLCIGISPLHWRKLSRVRRLSGLQRNVCCAAVNGLIYWLWYQRNVCRVDGTMLRPEVVVQQVRSSILLRLQCVGLQNVKATDRQWLDVING